MLDLQNAIAIATQKSGSTEAREDELLIMLENSAGSLGGQPYYRPWYVAAKALEQDLDAQSIESADDVKFTGQRVPIRSLLEWQAAIDSSSGAVVPEAFSAAIAVNSACNEARYPKMAITSI